MAGQWRYLHMDNEILTELQRSQDAIMTTYVAATFAPLESALRYLLNIA